jgi:hypothetical protein
LYCETLLFTVKSTFALAYLYAHPNEGRIAALHVPNPAPPINNPAIYTPPVNARAQFADDADRSPTISPAGIARIQSIVGSIGYYAETLDSTILTTIRQIASQQAVPTEAVQEAADHLLHYAATWPTATLTFYPSDMLLKIMTAPTSQSHAPVHVSANCTTSVTIPANHDESTAPYEQ